jgi:hypothetical protein
MEIEGIVHNGVIVPQGGCPLPEGTKVRVVPSENNSPQGDGNSSVSSGRGDQELIEAIRASKSVDPLPAGYDFLESLNANRGLGQRPLFLPNDESKGR